MVADLKVCATEGCGNRARGRRFCNSCNSRRWRQRHPEQAALHDLKMHARQRGIVCTLTLEEFCAVIAGTGYMERRGTGADDLQLDRIKSWRGYEAGNLQVITGAENGRKGRFERLDLFPGDADESDLEQVEEVEWVA